MRIHMHALPAGYIAARANAAALHAQTRKETRRSRDHPVQPMFLLFGRQSRHAIHRYTLFAKFHGAPAASAPSRSRTAEESMLDPADSL